MRVGARRSCPQRWHGRLVQVCGHDSIAVASQRHEWSGSCGDARLVPDLAAVAAPGHGGAHCSLPGRCLEMDINGQVWLAGLGRLRCGAGVAVPCDANGAPLVAFAVG